MAEKSYGEEELLQKLETKNDERLPYLREALSIARKAGKVLEFFYVMGNKVQMVFRAILF